MRVIQLHVRLYTLYNFLTLGTEIWKLNQVRKKLNIKYAVYRWRPLLLLLSTENGCAVITQLDLANLEPD